ncbi:response regulator transcription factor [Desertimonas flava]|uniref:response regulator transcription factor n=1 Tax=Desertimonas flava TaxID=2064846 RepID=UPI000E34081B|nr:response regulator transcription factor [Desertimonas flava]
MSPLPLTHRRDADAGDDRARLVVCIEDEPHHLRTLAGALCGDGYRVEAAVSASDARDLLEHTTPDLVVLDLGLPDMDGVELCRRLVVWPAAPVIVVSADHDDRTIVAALDAGASDYITKPFASSVLLARVRVALRPTAITPGGRDDVVSVGDLTLDPAAHRVVADGREVELRPSEFDLLERLMRHCGALVTHGSLVGRSRGDDPSATELNSLRIAVSRLRRQLGVGPRRPTIVTEAGYGYRLVPPEA